MERTPIVGLRKPMKLKDLRSPIEFTSERWFPVYSFEGYYEISSLGNIKNLRTGDYVKIHKTSKFDLVVLYHPDNYYGATTFNLIDVYSASILGEVQYMQQYDYRKGKVEQNE